MSLDKEKIKHVAKLARISIDEAKVESLTKDLNSIFKFIAVSYTHLTLPTICSV